MAQTHIRIESKNNANHADCSVDHNDRSAISQSVMEYLLHQDDRLGNFHQTYGLSVDDLSAEIDTNTQAGHKLHHKAKPFKELLFLFEAHHTQDDLQNVVDQIVAEFPGVRPMQLDGHRDEGHYNEAGEVVHNFHAHLLFTTNGEKDNKQFRIGGRKEMQRLQEICSEVLGMDRGVGLYEPGGRMDPAIPKKDRKPHQSHWQFRRERAALTEDAQQRDLSHQAETQEVVKQAYQLGYSKAETEAKEQYAAERRRLIESEEAEQADYQLLKKSFEERMAKMKAAFQKQFDQLQIDHKKQTEELQAELAEAQDMSIWRLFVTIANQVEHAQTREDLKHIQELVETFDDEIGKHSNSEKAEILKANVGFQLEELKELKAKYPPEIEKPKTKTITQTPKRDQGRS